MRSSRRRPTPPAPAPAPLRPARTRSPRPRGATALAAPAPAVPATLTPQEIEAAARPATEKDRRLIQHALNALGHDVGGADGKFGRRTRSGIRGWQTSKGYPVTGYLTGEQVDALEPFGRAAMERAEDEAEDRERERLAAAREEAELRERERLAAARAEADRKRRAADEDAFSWAKTLGTAESYDRYLADFPAGIHAEEARRQRDALRLAEAKRQFAADDAAFKRAKAVDTAAGYQEYLVAFPRGRHVAEARGLRDRRHAEERQAKDALKVFGTIMGGILNR